MREGTQKGIQTIALIFWSFYGMALIMPQPLWGLHAYVFLPAPWSYILWLIAGYLILSTLDFIRFLEFFRAVKWSKYLHVLCPIMYVGLTFLFPIYNSPYGDADLFRDRMGTATQQFHVEYLKSFLSVNFLDLKTGNYSVLSAVRIISFITGWDHTLTFRVLNSLLGGVFVYIWIQFIKTYLHDHRSRAIALVLGVTAPFTQFFYGHFEIYGPVMVCMLGYLVATVRHIENPTRKSLLLAGVFLVLCLKFHGSSLLLIPSFVILVLMQGKYRHHLESFLSWKNIAKYVLIPVPVIGFLLYVFLFKDFDDPRFLSGEIDYGERLFLPIQKPAPPLDRYTLLDFNHFVDFFNITFVWGGAIVFLIVVAAIIYSREIDWTELTFKVVVITMFLYGLLFFGFNPLMSMPMDVDLFSVPGPLFLVLGVILLKKLGAGRMIVKLSNGVLAIALLSIPIFVVNANPKLLSHRLETVGRYVFKTYWIRSAGDIGVAMDMMPEDLTITESRYQSILKDLEPFAIQGGDTEFANLLWQVGRFYRVKMKDYVKALEYHEKARIFDPDLIANYIGLMESNYFLERFEDAYRYSLKLVENNYPDTKKAFRIAIDCAIQAQLYTEVLQLSEAYLLEWKDEDIIQLNHEIKELLNKDRKIKG